MDEPTSGLDPNQIIEVRQLIRELAQERTVILSTHILPEVEMTCNRVIIIHEGKIVAVDTPENLTANMRDTTRFFVRISGDIDIAAKAIADIEGISDVTRVGDGLHVHWPAEADLSAAVSARIVELGMGLLEMKQESMSLEEIFHALTMHEEEG